MNPVRSRAFDHEITRAKDLIAKGDLEASMAHLERAHVIGQTSLLPHAKSHWLMLRLYFRRGRIGAVVGQAVRLGLGLLGNTVGVVPTGNIGSSDVSMFKRMPIEPELKKIIEQRQ